MEVVDKFPHPKRGRPPKYNWDEYFDGQIYVLYKGVDFDSALKSFRALVHRTARARGYKAETQINPDKGSVMFRFYQECE